MYFETSDLKIHFLMIRNSEIPIKYPYLGTLSLTLVNINSRVAGRLENLTVGILAGLPYKKTGVASTAVLRAREVVSKVEIVKSDPPGSKTNHQVR